ncbi:MAG: hypothetical protein ABI647_04245 [Gemmatimonadota bacterium]
MLIRRGFGTMVRISTILVMLAITPMAFATARPAASIATSSLGKHRTVSVPERALMAVMAAALFALNGASLLQRRARRPANAAAMADVTGDLAAD